MVAPPVAALPDIYHDHVVFVAPPDGQKPLELTDRSPIPNVDSAYTSEATVRAYAEAIQRLEADPVAKEAHRARGTEWARRTFEWDAITSAFYRDVTVGVSNVCHGNVLRKPEARDWSFVAPPL